MAAARKRIDPAARYPAGTAGCLTSGRRRHRPDGGSFCIALNAARDLLTQAANVIVGAVVDLIGALGRRVLDNLLPDRRLRVSPRIVKRAISKFQARGPNINRRSYKATLTINILTAPEPWLCLTFGGNGVSGDVTIHFRGIVGCVR
jgi:hypothetical protein